MTSDVELRPATPADAALLWDVQWRALGAHVHAVFGRSEAEQHAWFVAHHDPSATSIVVIDGHDAGFFDHRVRADHWYLGNIALLPAYQGRGVGSALVRGLLDDADDAGVSVRLQVLRGNHRARRLYRRLGLRVDGRTASHDLMVREPRPRCAP